MGDKVVESVVEKAMALQEIAIEAAKQRVIEEITPRIKKALGEAVEKESKKVLEQKEEIPEDPDEMAGQGEAEIDLDDLAKELEQGEDTGSDEIPEEDEEETADAESIEDKVAKLEGDVEEIKDDVKELKDGEGVEEGGSEEAESEAPADDGGDEDLEECINIDVSSDEDVNVNVSKDSEPAMDFAPLPAEEEVEAGDEEEDMEEVKEARRNKIAKAIKEMKIRKLRERIANRKRAMKEQADVEKDADVFIDIVDDTNMDDETTPDREDWEKTRPSFQERKNTAMLKRKLAITERKLNYEKVQSLRAKKIMSETALLNKKLILASKIFAEYNLSKNGKVNVLNEFDKATTIRESVMVYNKIIKALSKKMVKESKEDTKQPVIPEVKETKVEEQPKEDKPKDPLLEAAKPVGTLPQDRILSMDRLQRLAGIKSS